MKLFSMFVAMLFVCLNTSTLDADIYMWIDENGVKHYSNTAPSQDAEVTQEIKDSGSSRTMDLKQRRDLHKTIREKRTNQRKPPMDGSQKPVGDYGLQGPVRNSDSLKTVHDPSVAAAINGFNAKMEAIGSKCDQETDKRGCMCDHLPEIIKANQAKIDAFQGLLKKRPELVNQMVKIEGVFGNWYLDPEDPAIQKRDDLNFWRDRYNCK